jgi:hypothetical protein
MISRRTKSQRAMFTILISLSRDGTIFGPHRCPRKDKTRSTEFLRPQRFNRRK